MGNQNERVEPSRSRGLFVFPSVDFRRLNERERRRERD